MANDVGQIQLTISVDDRGTVAAIDRTKKLEASIKKLANARASQAITEKQYKKGLLEINRQMRTSNMSYQKAGPIIRKYAKAQLNAAKTTNTLSTSTAILNRNVGNTRNRMNGANMAIQQMGYQFGDFAVQVQGGTSAFVAFSQQGSQLVGILPSIAGSLGLTLTQAVALSSVLGVMIPIGSAVGRMFMEMSGNSKSAKDKIEELIEALNGLESLSFNSSLSSVQAIEDKWSNTLKLVREYYATIAEDNKTALFESAGVLVKDMESLAGQIKAIGFEKEYQGKLDESSASLLEELNEEYNHLKRTKEILVGLDTSSKKNLADSFRVVVDTLTAEGRLTKELTTQLALFAEQANISSVINKEKKNASDNQISSIQHFYTFQAQEEAIALESKKRVAEIVKKLREDAAEAERTLNLSIVKNRMDGVTAHYKYEEKMAKEKAARDKRVAEIKEKERLRLVDLATKASGTQGRGGAIAPTKGQVSEMGMGPQDTGLQGRLNLQEKIFTSLVKQSKTLEYTVGLSDRELIVGEQKLETFNFINQLQKAGLRFGSDAYNSAVMQLEVNQERILAAYDLAEAEKLAEEEATRRNNILLEQYSKIEQELQDQAQKQKQLADSIANTFGDAFMSIVDGTESAKDAFRSMARDIIKQLYQILVVEQMVNSISGAIQGSFGGAPQGPMPSGNVVPDTRMFKLANGGVIGGPTSFRTSSGQSGLMGEAGPEAIMPLKRGANGKLGVQMEGGGATTVVQNFNFSANGDDSVKRIIAQAAPKIAEMTKSQIVNDRKRGGSMKAAFG